MPNIHLTSFSLSPELQRFAQSEPLQGKTRDQLVDPRETVASRHFDVVRRRQKIEFIVNH